jgi:hypothetical protein
VGRVERSVGLEVIELSRPGAGHENAPNVAPAVQIGVEIDDIARLAGGDVPVQQDPHRPGAAAENDELHPPIVNNGTVRKRVGEPQDGRAVGHSCQCRIVETRWNPQCGGQANTSTSSAAYGEADHTSAGTMVAHCSRRRNNGSRPPRTGWGGSCTAAPQKKAPLAIHAA